MSGGSFNYLYNKDAGELFYSINDLEDMRDSLIELGYDDIANDTQEFLEFIKCAQCTIDKIKDMLKPVLKAVEWYESADYDRETMINVLEEYRKK